MLNKANFSIKLLLLYVLVLFLVQNLKISLKRCDLFMRAFRMSYFFKDFLFDKTI